MADTRKTSLHSHKTACLPSWTLPLDMTSRPSRWWPPSLLSPALLPVYARRRVLRMPLHPLLQLHLISSYLVKPCSQPDLLIGQSSIHVRQHLLLLSGPALPYCLHLPCSALTSASAQPKPSSRCTLTVEASLCRLFCSGLTLIPSSEHHTPHNCMITFQLQTCTSCWRTYGSCRACQKWRRRCTDG